MVAGEHRGAPGLNPAPGGSARELQPPISTVYETISVTRPSTKS